MAIDYEEIGRKIRKYRKAEGWSREALASKINISVSHMSNIETGNTKLSLPVLCDIAEVLSVGMDDLLGRHEQNMIYQREEIAHLLEDCSEKELLIMKEAMLETKSLIDRFSKCASPTNKHI